MHDKDPKTGKFLPRDQEAPDPLDVARAESEGLPASAAAPSMADALVMIAEALKTIKAGDTGASERLAGIEAFLLHQEKARPHENLFNPPLVSSLNPLGERDHPRPELKCKMIWVGYKMAKDTLTRQEIELLNRLQPGDYRVTKADGRTIPFKVTPKYTDNGNLEHLNIHFPCKLAEDRQNHLSMVSYLSEALGEVANTDTLKAQIASLKAQLAGVQAA